MEVAVSTLESTAPPPERLHALDAVRGLALILGIVFHATMSFLPTPIPLWIVMDHDRSVILAVVFHVLHLFRMTTYFLIAGFFAHMMFYRRGAKGFVIDRLKRIGIPLVVGWLVLGPMILAVSIWGALTMFGGTLESLPKPPASTQPLAFPLTHLWFLYLLLILYAVTLAARSLVAAVDRSGRLRAAGDKALRAVLSVPLLAPVLLGAPTALALCLLPQWPMWFGIPTPDSSLIPNAPAFIGFFTAFGLGWVMHRQDGLIQVWEKTWGLNLAAAVATTAGGLAITGVEPLMAYAAPEWRTWLYAALLVVSIWTWTFAVIGLALKFLAGHSPARRYIADASYWLYLIHLPIIMALQVAVAPLVWPWWVKFPLILAVAFPIMFASYHLLVRHSFIGSLLNGRKYAWPSARVRAAAPASSAA
jgi:peptidoglycan/LPS O-acetylase OafA/YrhL